MKKLYVQYCYSEALWGLFDTDLNDYILYDASMHTVVSYAYKIAELIRPAEVILIPQYLLDEYLLCSCY
ncbi:MAG TPA: hypothetical protein DCY20_04750 [Firmicutes bacterium]|nr:hypothetical protein [Bacillota bacterium]